MNKNNHEIKEIHRLVRNAKRSQFIFEKFTKKQVDKVVSAAAWALCNPINNKYLSKLAVKTTKLGNYEDKFFKNRNKTIGLLRDLSKAKTIGVINKDKKNGIIEIAKPVGVVAALTPSTNPIATPMNNILNALKCRNSIIISPSPSGEKVFKKLLKIINKELNKIKAPKNLIQTFALPVSLNLAKQLMKQVDLTIVTGAQHNVRDAYSSGMPSIGVGAGNVCIIIDETANLNEAAKKIKLSKTFDNGTSCSAENNIIVIKKIYKKFLKNLVSEGGFLLNSKQKNVLRKKLWINDNLNRNLIAKPADEILSKIGIKAKFKNEIRFILVNESGVGKKYPFSGEKLSPILSIYKADNFKSAQKIINKILNYQGKGHSVGIFTSKNSRVLQLGLTTPVCRVIKNQAHVFAAGGSFSNGLPFTLSLGCGTWGKNSIDTNLNYKHFLNITKISTPITEKKYNLKFFFKKRIKSLS